MPVSIDAIMAMPTFSLSGGPSNRLDLLASAATLNQPGVASLTPVMPGPRLGSLLGSGGYNPAASLPPKLVRRILDLEFVDVAKLTTDVELSMPGRPAHTHPITDISVWVERFTVMAVILATRFSEKAPEFFAYMATIVRAEHNYEGERWVVYDCQFCRDALVCRDLNWSATDPRLYNEAFTGRAKCIARCGYCLRDDHTTRSCPTNPSRAALGGSPERPAWPQQGAMSYRPGSGRSRETCRRFNELRCKFPHCRYKHVCSHCGGHHPLPDCTQVRVRARSRSPMRGRAQGQLAPCH